MSIDLERSATTITGMSKRKNTISRRLLLKRRRRWRKKTRPKS